LVTNDVDAHCQSDNEQRQQLLMAAVACLSDASIYRKYRNIDSISTYRIVSYRPQKYLNFRYTGIDFLIYHLAEFSRVVSRSREIFIETFIETFTGKRITEFRKSLHYNLLVRIYKAVISRRGHCLSSVC